MRYRESTRRPGIHARILLPLIIPGVVCIVWYLVSTMELVPPYLLPSPATVVDTGFHYIFADTGTSPYAGRFLSDLLASFSRVSAGFFLAVLIGLPTGILSGRVPFIKKLLSGSINGLRAIPGISLLPLSLVWFGIGFKTTVFLVGLAAFFPIYLNCASGAAQVSPLLLQAGAMMGVGRVRGTFFILLPATMPNIITGLRLGLGIAWAYLVLGELSGVPNGLGAVIMDARMLGRIDMIMVGIVIIAVIGQLTDILLQWTIKRLFKSARRMR